MQKDIATKLEEEYQRFIQFGNLLDTRTRRYLIEYLKAKLAGRDYEVPALNDRYFDYFKSALDELFSIQYLLELCAKNEMITQQVVLDLLYWLRKTYSKVKTEHPYKAEVDLLGGWSVTPLRIIEKRYPYLIAFLRDTYTPVELDPQFYEQRIGAAFAKSFADWSSEEKERFELVFTDLLSQWDALLQSKILDYQLTKFKESQESFTELIENKVEEYRKLLSIIGPFTEYVGWDMSRDLWQNTSFDVVKKYNELLENEESLRRLANLLGELREAEIEMEEETFEKTIVRQEWKVDEDAKAEIVGVHESQDLSNLLSSEAALLSDVDSESLFLKKYADKGLLTFRYEDRRLVSSKDNIMEVHNKVRRKEKGPFIVCVDTSESMMGRPEEVAKVLTLGILKMAVQDNRRAYLINFSTGVQTIDLYDIASSIDELAKFLNMSFYGGTDATLALYEALRQLKGSNYEDADVLMISDFVMYKFDEDILGEVRYFQHNKGTEFHSLAISKEANSDLLQNFDTNWVYDPKDKGIIKEMTRGLEAIRER